MSEDNDHHRMAFLESKEEVDKLLWDAAHSEEPFAFIFGSAHPKDSEEYSIYMRIANDGSKRAKEGKGGILSAFLHYVITHTDTPHENLCKILEDATDGVEEVNTKDILEKWESLYDEHD